MIKRELLGTADIPGSTAPMSLYRQGEEFSIWVGGAPLMSSRQHGSEEALAELGCRKLVGKPGGHVLVGGLGMGFTLAAALRQCGPEASIRVAELVPAVHAWNREHLGALAGHPLDDPRTAVDIADVAQVMAAHPGGFDSILLDVDNGPSALTQDGNNKLYQPQGLDAIRKALRPGGIVTFWSAYADPAFTKRLGRAGFAVEEHQVGAQHGRGSRHVIWVGERR